MEPNDEALLKEFMEGRTSDVEWLRKNWLWILVGYIVAVIAVVLEVSSFVVDTIAIKKTILEGEIQTSILMIFSLGAFIGVISLLGLLISFVNLDIPQCFGCIILALFGKLMTIGELSLSLKNADFQVSSHRHYLIWVVSIGIIFGLHVTHLIFWGIRIATTTILDHFISLKKPLPYVTLV